VHWSPGLPCALISFGRDCLAKLGRIEPRPRDGGAALSRLPRPALAGRGVISTDCCALGESPSPARLRLRFAGRPLPAKAGRGDSKRFARCCLRLGSLKIESGNNSIHVVPDKRATASADPGSITTDVCCCAKLGYSERFNAPSWLRPGLRLSDARVDAVPAQYEDRQSQSARADARPMAGSACANSRSADQYSGKRVGYPPRSDVGSSGWRTSERLLSSWSKGVVGGKA